MTQDDISLADEVWRLAASAIDYHLQHGGQQHDDSWDLFQALLTIRSVANRAAGYPWVRQPLDVLWLVDLLARPRELAATRRELRKLEAVAA